VEGLSQLRKEPWLSLVRRPPTPPKVRVRSHPSKLDERSAEVLLGGEGVVGEDGTAERRGDASTAPARVLGRHLRLPELGVGLRRVTRP
jgi:hypothetical protein